MKSSKKRAGIKPRTLTHALIYDNRTRKWSCKCGYVLGSGHDALYALCPMYQRRKPDEAYLENKISSQPNVQTHSVKKAQRKTRSRRSGVSKTALDLFDI